MGVNISLSNAAAKSCVGGSWSQTWDSLLVGKSGLTSASAQFPDWPLGPPVGMVSEWPTGVPARAERFRELVGSVLREISDKLPDTRGRNLRCAVYLASSHGDPGPIGALATLRTGRLDSDLTERIICENLHPLLTEGLQSPILVHPIHAACASALVATVSAHEAVKEGLIDFGIVVAADCLSILAYTGFQSVGAMSPGGCRPFGVGRDGMSVAEGAVAFVVASNDCTAQDDRSISLVGGAYSCEGEGMVEPSVSGLESTIRRALDRTSVAPEQIDFVYWHGTGTSRSDAVESAVAKSLWNGTPPPGAALKGCLGHSMGAASGFSILGAGETILSGRVPAVGYTIDKEFAPMNIVAGQPAAGTFVTGLCVAMGFGGINSALVVQRRLG